MTQDRRHPVVATRPPTGTSQVVGFTEQRVTGERTDPRMDDEDLDFEAIVQVGRGIVRRSPRKWASRVRTVYKGAPLNVFGRRGRWYRIEHSSGDRGWILQSALQLPEDEHAGWRVRASARAGYTLMSQRFRSDGGANHELSQYRLDTGATNARVSLGAMYHVTPVLMLGIDGSYANSYGVPGILFQNEQGARTQMPFTIHELEAAAVLGFDLQHSSGAALYGRLGYHYNDFALEGFDDPAINLAHLPSETLHGYLLGGRLDIPRIAARLGASLTVDALLPGAVRTQSQGLTDGNLLRTNSLWAGSQLTYRVASKWYLALGYRFQYHKTIWQGAAERPTGVIRNAIRRDRGHAMSLGVNAAF